MISSLNKHWINEIANIYPIYTKKQMKNNAKSAFVLILWLIISFNSFAQPLTNQINPNGYNVFKYPNGQISSEGTMQDGKPDGYWKTYFPTGIIKTEGKRKNFLLDSVWIFYNEKSDTTLKINYLYGMKNGFFYTYKTVIDSSKKRINYVYSKELYVNDVKQGTSYICYSSGKIKEIIQYKDGRKQGIGKEYDSLGILISINQFRNDILVEKETINRRDKNGLKQGIWKNYFPNDAIKEEITYRNDKLDGYYKQFDETGKIIKMDRYDNGNLVVFKENIENKVVEKKLYFPNGQVKSIGGFMDEKPVGIHKELNEEGKIVTCKIYSELGILIGEGIFDEKGYKQGQWTEYFESGQIRSLGKYANNQKEGNWKFYFKSGKPEQTGNYKNGKPSGTWIWYYENGNILREEDFAYGKEEGMLAEYDENGNIITKGEYIEGYKNGKWYYCVGDDTQEGNYKDDQRDGEWIHYFPQKKMAFKGSYVFGEENGEHIYYFNNGNIKLRAFFKMSRKDGNWMWYDETGKLLMTITYSNDVEVKIDGNSIPNEEVKQN